MKKRRTTKIYAAASLLILTGLLHGSYFAGVPYQDPTPEMSENYEFHLSVMNMLLIFGFSLLIIGIIKDITNKYRK